MLKYVKWIIDFIDSNAIIIDKSYKYQNRSPRWRVKKLRYILETFSNVGERFLFGESVKLDELDTIKKGDNYWSVSFVETFGGFDIVSSKNRLININLKGEV